MKKVYVCRECSQKCVLRIHGKAESDCLLDNEGCCPKGSDPEWKEKEKT